MSLLIVIAVLVALVWGAAVLQRTTLLAGCLAFLVVGYGLGYWFLSFRLGPIPLTLDRLLLVALVAGYVVGRRLGWVDPKPLRGADWLLFGLVILLSLSTALWSTDSRIGAGGSPCWHLIASYWIPLVVYWLARQSHLTRKGLGLVLVVLTLLGFYLALTALAEVTGQWQFVFPRYIADPTLGMHFGRARGPMLAAQSLGLYLTVCFLAAWVLRTFVGRPLRWAIAATCPIWLAAIYSTYTRAAWLAVAAGLFVLIVLRLSRPWRVAVAGAALAAGLLVLNVDGSKLVGFERETSASETRRSVYQRAGFAYVSWRMFQDQPILGVGFGNFYEAKLPYLVDRSVPIELESLWPLEHHNTFLSLLTETGMVGLALFVAVLGSWFQAAWRLARNPGAAAWVRAWGGLMLGVLTAYLFPTMFHDVTLSPPDQCLIFCLAGITIGLQPAGSTTPPEDRPALPAAGPGEHG